MSTCCRAENKRPGTIAVHSDGTERYLRWCESTHSVPIARTSLHTWMAQLLDTGAAPGTVRTRQLAVRRFAAWLIATEQLPGDPFVGIKGPAQRYPVIMPLSEDGLRGLIATCTAPTHRPDEPLHHRRDIIRLMMETGIRAGELIALCIADLDLGVDPVSWTPRRPPNRVNSSHACAGQMLRSCPGGSAVHR